MARVRGRRQEQITVDLIKHFVPGNYPLLELDPQNGQKAQVMMAVYNDIMSKTNLSIHIPTAEIFKTVINTDYKVMLR